MYVHIMLIRTIALVTVQIGVLSANNTLPCHYLLHPIQLFGVIPSLYSSSNANRLVFQEYSKIC